MINVVIASQNPVKIKCTELAFTEVFKNESIAFTGISVPSNVSDQPMTDSETLEGARNRAKKEKCSHLHGLVSFLDIDKEKQEQPLLHYHQKFRSSFIKE